MSKRNSGWKVIKTLAADEARAIRVRELRSAAEAHADAPQWAKEYARRADALEAAGYVVVARLVGSEPLYLTANRGLASAALAAKFATSAEAQAAADRDAPRLARKGWRLTVAFR